MLCLNALSVMCITLTLLRAVHTTDHEIDFHNLKQVCEEAKLM